MEWLVLFVIMLAGVALVGHGIWVLVAAIGRALFASDEPHARCRHCGRYTSTTSGRCHWCAQPLGSPPPDEQADLAAVARQLERWKSRRALKPATVARLLARVDAYRKSLAQPAKPKAAEAVEPLLAEIVEARPPTPPAPRPRRTAPTLAPQTPGTPSTVTTSPVTPAVATPPASAPQ